MIKQIRFSIIILSVFTTFSCGNDDDATPIDEPKNIFLGCCSPDPVFGDNVDVLDQSQGEIGIPKILTVNGDGYNDTFWIDNIEFYANHMVTIYDPSDSIVFETTNYNSNNYFPLIVNNNFDIINEGTYKYKIVVENEQTFVKSGTFCLLKGFQPDNVSFVDCEFNKFDPALTGL